MRNYINVEGGGGVKKNLSSFKHFINSFNKCTNTRILNKKLCNF